MTLKDLANEDTLWRTHCCRHKCFPVCPRAQHLLRTQILCPRHKNVSDFVQKHFVSATNVSQFAQPKKHHGQQCVRNNVSPFTRAFRFCFVIRVSSIPCHRKLWLWKLKSVGWFWDYWNAFAKFCSFQRKFSLTWQNLKFYDLSTLRRRNYKTAFTPWKRVECFLSTLHRRDLR